ncbi:bile acid:sodium symporter family protein [Candidatus Pelagadaptatus aseana]|uniref:bile acid:sodium symporter family protein n=1 Tax=Candidatus Pelagadaptatus aseana TaxID=3120508 RepID=UPI003C6F9CB3
MSAQLLNTTLLPICLGLIMLALGLSLKPRHFINIAKQPGSVILGLIMQLALLPAIALLLVLGWQLSGTLAAGLILLALAPGGATSNAISFLARGDTALSISLTAITSLIVPFTLPLLLAIQYQWLGLDSQSFQIPVGPTTKQLVVVTLIPILIGMALRHAFDQPVAAAHQHIQRLVGFLFIALVAAMAWVNRAQLPELWSQATLAVLSLCIIAMCCAAVIARIARLNAQTQTTLAIEVGIQNAGTAMMVAATLMQQPALAMIALLYGIVMNLPAALIIFWRRRLKTR